MTPKNPLENVTQLHNCTIIGWVCKYRAHVPRPHPTSSSGGKRWPISSFGRVLYLGNASFWSTKTGYGQFPVCKYQKLSESAMTWHPPSTEYLVFTEEAYTWNKQITSFIHNRLSVGLSIAPKNVIIIYHIRTGRGFLREVYYNISVETPAAPTSRIDNHNMCFLPFITLVRPFFCVVILPSLLVSLFKESEEKWRQKIPLENVTQIGVFTN